MIFLKYPYIVYGILTREKITLFMFSTGKIIIFINQQLADSIDKDPTATEGWLCVCVFVEKYYTILTIWPKGLKYTLFFSFN